MSHTVHTLKVKTNRTSSSPIAIAVAGLLSLAACSSSAPRPTEALQAAESAITAADQARAMEYAAPELNEAREKLSAANNEVSQENNESAKRLAEQSRIDAELALAKSKQQRPRLSTMN